MARGGQNRLVGWWHISVAVLLAAAVLPAVMVSHASAASLTQSFVRFDRMKISTPTTVFTTGTVCAKTATAASTETSVSVTFPTGFTVSTTNANWTTSTTNLAWPTGGTAWPTIGATATSAVGQVVTWSSGDLSTGTLYCFNWTNNTTALSTPTSANPTLTGTVATNIDSATTYSTSAITDDQIQVSATVAQTFTFALSANTDNLGALSTGSVAASPTPRTATVNTNAKNGWQVWAQDLNTGLNSATASATIPSTTPGTNSTQVAGTPGYNTGVTQTQTSGTGTVTVAVPFVGGTLGRGGGLDTTLRTLASSNGTANGAVLTLTNNAAIGNITPSALDYQDTITVVGAGLF